jgi:CTP:molybdopterin cytidylyltransferase MocA
MSPLGASGVGPADNSNVAGIACAILAAGAARRFGGAKQLARLAGTPLLRRAVEAACGSSCARVAVVLGARAAAIAPVLAGLPVEVVENPAWAEGMASSVRAAAAWARQRDDQALLLAVADQPELSAAHLDALIAASGHGQRVAASAYAGVLGVPALFPRACYPALAALEGDVGARALLRGGGLPWLITSVDWAAGARDVDHASDLRAAAPLSARDGGAPSRRG